MCAHTHTPWRSGPSRSRWPPAGTCCRASSRSPRRSAICIYIYICIYICILYMYVYMHTSLSLYIYIYVHMSISISVTFCRCPAVSKILRGSQTLLFVLLRADAVDDIVISCTYIHIYIYIYTYSTIVDYLPYYDVFWCVCSGRNLNAHTSSKTIRLYQSPRTTIYTDL